MRVRRSSPFWSSVTLMIAITAFVLLACENGAAVGVACTRSSDCQRGLTCAVGRCREECAESRDCPIGARCLVDPGDGRHACSLDVDGCVGRECAAGFVCVEGE